MSSQKTFTGGHHVHNHYYADTAAPAAAENLGLKKQVKDLQGELAELRECMSQFIKAMQLRLAPGSEPEPEPEPESESAPEPDDESEVSELEPDSEPEPDDKSESEVSELSANELRLELRNIDAKRTLLRNSGGTKAQYQDLNDEKALVDAELHARVSYPESIFDELV